MSVQSAPVTASTIVVAIDVGKTSLMVSATDDARRRLMGPVEFAMTRSGLVAATERVLALELSYLQVMVGVEAAGHYHRPVADYRWPPGWKVVELNPAHVAEQRRVMGRCVGHHRTPNPRGLTHVTLLGIVPIATNVRAAFPRVAVDPRAADVRDVRQIRDVRRINTDTDGRRRNTQRRRNRRRTGRTRRGGRGCLRHRTVRLGNRGERSTRLPRR